MPSPYIALPPGIYNIQAGGQNIVNPGTNGNQLTTAAVTNKPNQQWLISGSGIIQSIEPRTWAFSDLVAADTKISRNDDQSSGSIQWIISVIESTTDNSFTGSIMTNDSHRRYWGVDATKVQLDDTLTTKWKFVPVWELAEL